MSDLKARLHDDLTTAMKARDELRTATLRMALTAIKNEEVSGGEARELDDAAVLKVLAREGKKRREAAEAFANAGRAELAEREVAEGRVLEEYLPAQLSDEELTALVAAAVAEAGATSPQQMGAVMKLVTPQVAGRAEGGRVAAAVKRALAGA
ncbi:MAG TPA: GatB/YqeY domain-containing protein [Frankiaceae bacterium]|nr:GatB/YqeY domain-containing protein [Frankiaceae bacterium]